MKKILLIVLLIVTGCASEENEVDNMAKYQKATFAGGCFWCMEPAFEKEKGVKDVISGYTGGDTVNPTYQEVSKGNTGHYEAIEVYYDPNVISYKELLDIFWMSIDPSDDTGQFSDRGSQYRTVIFYQNESERELAEESKKKQSIKFDKPIVTEIRKLGKFYKAEEYHQDYYKKSPIAYNIYKSSSGRETLKKNKDTSKEDMKIQLTPMQYKVTQECGTEPAFNNEHWDNKKEGIYVDIVSGEPLFSSKDKFDSGTGWPSFTKPLVSDNIVEKDDKSLGMTRTEVKSKNADSHLGHVFDDGPNGSMRYCINSAALRFIPKEDLEKEGYGEYLYLFE